MKTASLFFLGMVCLLSTTSNAQPYQPAAIEGAHWFMYQGGGYETYHHAFAVRGDTIIDNQAYKKLYYQELANFGVPLEPPYLKKDEYLWGALRDDTMARQVLVIPFEPYWTTDEFFTCEPDFTIGEEMLLHDFSAAVGDTIGECVSILYDEFTWIVDSIYTTSLYGQDRRTLADQTGEHPVLYEGIGSMHGLVGTPFLITYVSYGLSGFNLVDYCIGTDEECGVVSSSQEILQEVNWQVFPNPASDRVNFEWEQSLPKNVQLFLFDHLGSPLLSAELPVLQNQLELNVGALSKGIYFYQIAGEKKILGRGKLIVE